MTATLLSPLPVLLVPVRFTDPPTPPDTECLCGGPLIYVATTRVKLDKTALRALHRTVMLVEHIEACAECLDGGDPRECRHLHLVCITPEAAQCGHHGCHADTRSPAARPCAQEHAHCCGCCWADYYGEE